MYEEIGTYGVEVVSVSWEKPKRGGYFYARIWNRKDPQYAVKCPCRHRTEKSALLCGRKIIKRKTTNGLLSD